MQLLLCLLNCQFRLDRHCATHASQVKEQALQASGSTESEITSICTRAGMIWLPGKASIWPGVAWQLSSTIWHAERLVATLPKRQFLGQGLLKLPYLFFIAIDLGQLRLGMQLKVAACLCVARAYVCCDLLNFFKVPELPHLVFGRRRVLGWW